MSANGVDQTATGTFGEGDAASSWSSLVERHAVADLVEQGQFASVSGPQIFGCENLRDGAGGHQSHVQQQDVVEIFGHCLEIVVDDQCSLSGLEVPGG